MTKHELKTWPVYFDATVAGDKPFDVRRDDRGFQKGDVVILKKFDPKRNMYITKGFGANEKVIEATFEITWILTGGQFGLEPGFVVLGLKPAATGADHD